MTKEEAINILTREIDEDPFIRTEYREQVHEALNMAVEAIKAQKVGHWITQWNVTHQKEYYYCSECREEFSYDGETGIKMNDYSFCPNCGAKLKVIDRKAYDDNK